MTEAKAEVVTVIGEAEKTGCSDNVIEALREARQALHVALGFIVNEIADQADSLDLSALEGRGHLVIDVIRLYRRLGTPSKPKKAG